MLKKIFDKYLFQYFFLCFVQLNLDFRKMILCFNLLILCFI